MTARWQPNHSHARMTPSVPGPPKGFSILKPMIAAGYFNRVMLDVVKSKVWTSCRHNQEISPVFASSLQTKLRFALMTLASLFANIPRLVSKRIIIDQVGLSFANNHAPLGYLSCSFARVSAKSQAIHRVQRQTGRPGTFIPSLGQPNGLAEKPESGAYKAGCLSWYSPGASQMLSALVNTVLLLAAIPAVIAHGYVETITVGSSSWPGWNPNVDPYLNPTPARVVRKIPGNGPVEQLNLIDVQCNGYTAGGTPGSAPAASIATVPAGSTINFKWTTWPDSHLGPTLTYLARVPDGKNITSWTPAATDKVFFKIHHDGKDSSGVWATAPRLLKNNNIISVKIPSTLKPGQYLVRHEILALHAAWTYPGAQVYPSCAQIQVTGSGSALPASSYLVAFPGESSSPTYGASTPGIVFDVYQGPATYPLPGPAVWSG